MMPITADSISPEVNLEEDIPENACRTSFLTVEPFEREWTDARRAMCDWSNKFILNVYLILIEYDNKYETQINKIPSKWYYIHYHSFQKCRGPDNNDAIGDQSPRPCDGSSMSWKSFDCEGRQLLLVRHDGEGAMKDTPPATK